MNVAPGPPPVAPAPGETCFPGGRWGFWVGTLLGAVALGYLFVWDPAGEASYPLCPFHALTGLFCPGCGSLRALHQLLHGHLPAALDYNALTVLAVPLVLYGWLSQARLTFLGRAFPPLFRRPRTIWMLLTIIILFGVVRNIPGGPWVLLAP